MVLFKYTVCYARKFVVDVVWSGDAKRLIIAVPTQSVGTSEVLSGR